ncbi:MAG: acetolactate synthase [Christensenellales bacterium]|jgi:hypothetical protein
MLVKQIAVFLENRKGRIYELTRVLANENIDIIAMSIADTTDFGILRLITKDNMTALKVLREAGFTATTNDLIGISVDDKPGGLNKALKFLDDNDIEIEYLYSFARVGSKAIILIKVEDILGALTIMKKSGIELLSNDII